MNNDYASHMILLAALARHYHHRVTHIVELGCGLYSTSIWLNRSLWTSVQSVLSYEHNPQWSRHIEYLANDRRLTIIGEMPQTIGRAGIVLIDNGDNRAQRLEGIKHVVRCKPSGLVILHDANEEQYLDEIEPHFEHCAIYTGAYPHTALLWNGDKWNWDELINIIDEIGQYE